MANTTEGGYLLIGVDHQTSGPGVLLQAYSIATIITIRRIANIKITLPRLAYSLAKVLVRVTVKELAVARMLITGAKAGAMLRAIPPSSLVQNLVASLGHGSVSHWPGPRVFPLQEDDPKTAECSQSLVE